ncbi:AraC family transcriptional regulator [Alteribacter natronophilus]|uniref:AraC family transcriptional regulator n=1 Tax=Alteribacter natronophilus TaxID=2583810 RepID=UPI00110E091F|nr:helix-turn-helix domain-containing protein [Alteribacter natronophilus]TMW71508.1 helix-turn-helix transcriptional regulator [Alteribacter natronophilus]
MKTIRAKIPPLPVFIKGGKGSFRKGQKHFSRTFEVFDLLAVKKGTLYMKEEGVSYEVKEGEYLILVPGIKHGGWKECTEDTEIYWIHFKLPGSYETDRLKDFDWSDILKKESTYTEEAIFELIIPTYGQIHNRNQFETMMERLNSLNLSGAPADQLQQQALFYESLLFLQREAVRLPTSAEQVASEAIRFIHRHYNEPALKVEGIARALLYHVDYVARCVKRTTGLTPGQYINRCRIERAKEMLLSTELDLEAVAAEVGILDRSYFSRLFKKYEGITPTAFRSMRVKREW